MAKKPSMAFGKGLSAILAEAAEVQLGRQTETGVPGLSSVTEISLDKIVPNPFQPRTAFNQEALEELAASIRSLGIIQPVTLRQGADGKYQIISGERRFRAAKLAGLKTIPAYVRKADDGAMLEMALVENIQRENLDPIETALAYRRLIEECKLTQEAMADRVGKKRTTVTNYLRLLKLPPEVQKALKAGLIDTGHAKALLGVENRASQLELCEKAIINGWSVRRLEEIIRNAGTTRPSVIVRDCYIEAAEKVRSFYDGKVSVSQNRQGGGSLTIKFKDEKQLERFLKAFEGRKEEE